MSIRDNRTADSRGFSAAVASLLERAYAFYPFFMRRGSDPFALKRRTVIGALEQVRFLVVRNLKLRDNLSAETRGANKDCGFAYALSCRCGNFNNVLDCLVGLADIEELPTQQQIYEITSLDLVSACRRLII